MIREENQGKSVNFKFPAEISHIISGILEYFSYFAYIGQTKFS